MRNVTTKEPVRQIPVKIPPCPRCKGTEATLYISYLTHCSQFLGINFLKTHSREAAFFCDGCNKHIRPKGGTDGLKGLASSELKKVKISFFQRYGAWIILAMLVVLIKYLLHV